MQESDENRRRVTLAGELLFVGATWATVAITLAESLTLGYSVSSDTINGLGLPLFSTVRGTGVCSKISDCLTPIQPASAVFISAVFLFGILQLWSGLL